MARLLWRHIVVKTPTSDMNEGALGGNIDVKTFHPFDVGTSLTANIRGTYTTATDKVKPNATLIGSYTNNSGTFGVLLGGQYWAKEVRNDRFFNFGWKKDTFQDALGSGYYTPTRTRPTIETEDRERISGLLSMQWRPNDEAETTLDILATRLDVAFDEFGLDIYPDTGAIDPSRVQVEGDTVVAATINDVRFLASREYSLNRHDLIDINLRQKWDHDRWHLNGRVNWSYAHSFQPSNPLRGEGQTVMRRFAACCLAAISAMGATALMAKPNDNAHLRMNDIQVVGSHNSFKARIPDAVMAELRKHDAAKADGLDYYHLPLREQLDRGVRQIEIDIFADPEGSHYANPQGEKIAAAAGEHTGFNRNAMLKPGFKVFHIPDIDYLSTCVTLVRCLGEVNAWSEAHPRHLPIMITINAADMPQPMDVTTRITLDDASLLDALDAKFARPFPVAG